MPSVLQHASAVQQYTAGTTGTITPAFTNPVAAGNCLAACISISTSSGTSTPAISAVTTNGSAENWAQSAEDADQTVFIWADPSTGGGQHAIDISAAFGQTATTTDSVAVMADIFEIPGTAAASPVDRTSTDFLAPVGSASWTSGTTAATRTPSQIWLGCAWIGSYLNPDTTETVTPPGSPWTDTTVLTTSVQAGGTGTGFEFFVYQVCGWQVVSSTGTATYAGTASITSFWSAAVVTLKGAAGGLPRPVLLNQAVMTAATW